MEGRGGSPAVRRGQSQGHQSARLHPNHACPGQKKSVASKSKPREPIAEIDPELRYSFQRNTQVMPWFLFTFFFKNKILVSLSCEKYCFSQVLCFFTCGGWFTQFSLYYTCNLIFSGWCISWMGESNLCTSFKVCRWHYHCYGQFWVCLVQSLS